MGIIQKELMNSLQKQYYAQIPFPIERSQIEEAMSSFFQFLEQPDEIKNYIDFTIAPMHRRGDVGFKHRDPGDHIYNDSKDFFHYHPAIFEKHAEFLDRNPNVKDFMLKAKPIWEEVSEIISHILTEMESDHPGLKDKIMDTEHPHILLRFLKYNWEESQKNLAKPHFDAGSFTLAIAESCQGLRIGSGPEDLKLVEHIEGNALFMISSNYQKIMENSDLKPAWHDVIQLDETKIGKSYARWALVAFIEAKDVEALSREENHRFYIPFAA